MFKKIKNAFVFLFRKAKQFWKWYINLYKVGRGIPRL